MEIVDNSGGNNLDDRLKVEIIILFVEYLIVDFKSFMVYGLDFYKFCIERLIYKVVKVYIKWENEREFFECLVENVLYGLLLKECNEKLNVFKKCLKCGFNMINFLLLKL